MLGIQFLKKHLNALDVDYLNSFFGIIGEDTLYGNYDSEEEFKEEFIITLKDHDFSFPMNTSFKVVLEKLKKLELVEEAEARLNEDDEPYV